MNTRKSQVRHDSVRSAVTVLVVGGVVFALACADASRTVTEPTSGAAIAPGGQSLALGPNDPVTPGVVTLCKVGVDGAFNVQVGVGAAASSLTMAGNTCQTIATVPPTQKDDVIVTVTENTGPSYALDHILVRQGQAADRIITGERSVSLEAAHGAVINYYNNAAVTVCEHGTGATFQYQMGLDHQFQNLALADGQCQSIGTVPYAQADDVIVTVHDNPSATYTVDHMTLQQGLFSDARTITGTNSASFEAVHGAVLTYYHNPVTTSANGGGQPGGHPDAKTCDADKSLKDPKVHDENHDCRSEQGEQNDKKYTGK